MGYSVEQMMQGFVDNRGNNITSVSNKVLCNDGTYDIGNGKNAPCINKGGQKQINPIEGGQAFLDRQNEIVKQQALMQEMGAYNNRLTDKVFGKQEGWSFERPMRLGAYIIVGAFVGRYVAKNMKKSTTLGMVVGGLAPLLAYQLSIEYDRKNMPKQEPKQPVAIESTPMPQITIKPNAMPLDLSSQELEKTPNEFTIKSNGFNIRYYKIIDKNLTGFKAFGVIPDLYKQPFSTNGMSGVQPTKITTREFLDAYNEFLKQPK
jgi:hypothetical protein